METTLIRIPVAIHKALKVASAAAGQTTAKYAGEVLFEHLKTTAGAPYLPKELKS